MANPIEKCGELPVQMNMHGLERKVIIPYALSNGVEDITQVDTLMLMGMGEEHPAVARSAAITLGACGLSAASLMLPFRDFSPDDMPWLVHEATAEFAQALGGEPRALSGDSRGGAVALITAGEAPELFSAVGVLAPAALSNRFLGDKPMDRRKTLAGQLGIRNTFRQPPTLVGIQTAWRVGQEFRAHHKRGRGHLGEAIDYALTDELGKYAAAGVSAMIDSEKPIKIFAGDKDPLFTYLHIRSSLEFLGCTRILESVPGAHASVGSRLGRRQLHVVGKWLAGATGVERQA